MTGQGVVIHPADRDKLTLALLPIGKVDAFGTLIPG